MTGPTLHPDITALAPLVGTWSGEGHGHYPTIESFVYHETITFGHAGKPFLAYQQRTHSLDDPPMPMHAEAGYLRSPGPERVELVVAHPTGITEIDEGTITLDDDSIVIELTSTHVGLSSSAKSVTAITRRFVLRGDELDYDVAMAAVGQPLTHHLRAVLYRAD